MKPETKNKIVTTLDITAFFLIIGACLVFTTVGLVWPPLVMLFGGTVATLISTGMEAGGL